jgi:hypothetical protein
MNSPDCAAVMHHMDSLWRMKLTRDEARSWVVMFTDDAQAIARQEANQVIDDLLKMTPDRKPTQAQFLARLRVRRSMVPAMTSIVDDEPVCDPETAQRWIDKIRAENPHLVRVRSRS